MTSGYYTPEETALLNRTSIGIAGAGGIGSNLALMLIRAGFSQLTTVDFDRVTASNLNRQTYYSAHIGK